MGTTVWSLQQQMTHREFVEWVVFLQWEQTNQTKQDYYLAQIACEVRRASVTQPQKIKTEDFLLVSAESAEESSQRRLARSKGAWAGALGIDVAQN